MIALLVSAWLAPYLPPDMVWPVRAYTIVISLMVVMAFGTLGAGATPLIVAGASLFYLSDLSVAAMRFTDPLFPTYVLGCRSITQVSYAWLLAPQHVDESVFPFTPTTRWTGNPQ